MSGWDFEKDSGGKKADFTKFPTGITRIRIIDEAPTMRWTHWITKISKGVTCPGKGCPICEIRKQQKANKEDYTYNMSRRYAMQVLNRETNNLEIMEQGITFFEDIRDLMMDLKEEGKSLIDVDLKVRRRGTGKDDTSYRIDIAEEYPLSPEDEQKIKEKNNLNEYFIPHTPEQILALINGVPWEEVMNKEEDENEEVELS